MFERNTPGAAWQGRSLAENDHATGVAAAGSGKATAQMTGPPTVRFGITLTSAAHREQKPGAVVLSGRHVSGAVIAAPPSGAGWNCS